MRREAWAVVLGCALWMALASGCKAPQVTAPLEPFPDAAAFQPFLVPRAPLPLEAEGAVRVTFRGETESGGLRVQGWPGGGFRLQVRAPLTGGLSLDVRFDAERLLVVDYINDAVHMGANNAENRRALFEVDLTPEEFQWVLTGRLPHDLYVAGGGTPESAAEGAPGASVRSMRHEGAEFRFELDSHGLPARWSKSVQGRQIYRVEYREYLSEPAGAAGVLRLPGKIRVYGAAPKPLLVIGLSRFALGTGDPRPVDLLTVPQSARDFPVGGLFADPPR